ncbi:hypothetical protein D3C81_998600 [compost metagenome]
MPATTSPEMLSVKKCVNARPIVSAASMSAPVLARVMLTGRPLMVSTVIGSAELFGITRNQPRLTILLPADCACAAPASAMTAPAASIFFLQVDFIVLLLLIRLLPHALSGGYEQDCFTDDTDS